MTKTNGLLGSAVSGEVTNKSTPSIEPEYRHETTLPQPSLAVMFLWPPFVLGMVCLLLKVSRG